MQELDSKVTMEGKNLAQQELPPEDLLSYSQSILSSFLGMKDYIFVGSITYLFIDNPVHPSNIKPDAIFSGKPCATSLSVCAIARGSQDGLNFPIITVSTLYCNCYHYKMFNSRRISQCTAKSYINIFSFSRDDLLLGMTPSTPGNRIHSGFGSLMVWIWIIATYKNWMQIVKGD